MGKKKGKETFFFSLRQNAPMLAASHNLDTEWITCEDRLVQRSANGFKQ